MRWNQTELKNWSILIMHYFSWQNRFRGSDSNAFFLKKCFRRSDYNVFSWKKVLNGLILTNFFFKKSVLKNTKLFLLDVEPNKIFDHWKLKSKSNIAKFDIKIYRASIRTSTGDWYCRHMTYVIMWHILIRSSVLNRPPNITVIGQGLYQPIDWNWTAPAQ